MTTTRDLILRAEQYANKENASFYSYAEKVAMLNESYVSLYQYLCNTGDKYWVKEYISDSKEIILPKDCYQISAVYEKSNNRIKQIYDYKLKNNTIYIDREHLNSVVFIVEYYPQPIELNYKDDIKKAAFQLSNMVDISDGKVLIKDATYFKIYDTVSKRELLTSLPISDLAHMYDDGNIVSFGSTYKAYNIGTKTLTDLGNILVIYNNCVFYVNNGNICDIAGNIVATSNLSAGAYITEDFNTFKQCEGTLPINNRTCIKNTANIKTGITDDCKVYTKYEIKGYCDNAFLTYDALSGIYYIESLYNNVVIDYPNNVFYTIIAIDVALKMRSKQGIENGQLQQQYIMARDSLFNSINKNKGNHIVIKDVYEDDQLGSIYY
jgi:hypothetical protein